LLFALARAKLLATSLHRIIASLLQIVKCSIEVEAVPSRRAFQVDGLWHPPKLDKFEKLGAAKSNIGGSALKFHAARRVGEMIRQFVDHRPFTRK